MSAIHKKFKNNALITLEPWRVKSFPLIQDLLVDRNSLDNLIISGGYLTTETGGSPDANSIPISPERAFSSLRLQHGRVVCVRSRM